MWRTDGPLKHGLIVQKVLAAADGESVGKFVAGLFALAALVLWAAGFWMRPRVRSGPMPPMRVGLKHFTGPYTKVGPHFKAAGEAAADKAAVTLGLYYDDPANVAAAELRYSVGVVVASGAVEGRLKAAGYEIVDLPAAQAVTTEFPSRMGMLSVMMAAAKVYPAIAEFLRSGDLSVKHKAGAIAAGAAVEVYHFGEGHIKYFVPLGPGFMLHRSMRELGKED